MRSHIYRTYERLGITVCQNCAKLRKNIEAEPHEVMDHGYCSGNCTRCRAEICTPPALGLIQPTDVTFGGY